MTANEQMEEVKEEPLLIDHVLALLKEYERDLATAHLRIRELELMQNVLLKARAELELRAMQPRVGFFALDPDPLDVDERVFLAFRPIAASPGFLEEILRHIRARRLLLSLSREQLRQIATTLSREQATQLRDLYASWAFVTPGGAS